LIVSKHCSQINLTAMKKIYPLFILPLLLFSCSSRVSYLGSHHAPTQKVDVYVDASSIKKPYTIVGKGFFHAAYPSKNNIDKMQTKAIAKAREKGADAIFFETYYLVNDGTAVRSVTQTDSVGRGTVTVNNTTVSPIISSGTNILFLKYQ
jgi:hypothetical protein